MILLYALLVAFLITLCALAHEGGHFIAAKRAGVDVEDFALGMGKPIKTWKSKSGTTFTLKMLPVGGSVTPRGMSVEDVEESGKPKEGSFIYASPWARFKITTSGIVANIAFAVLIELIIIPFYMKPDSWEDFISIPATAFWATLALVGSFIQMIIQAPLNGFSNVASVANAPFSFGDSVDVAQSEGMPILLLIAIALITFNLFMAVFNVLPIYPLDGFYIATSVMDWGRRGAKGIEAYEPLTEKRLRFLMLGGYTVVIGLTGYLIIRDLVRLLISS